MKVPLNKPITAHDEEITVLELKEPTTKIVRELGMPYRFGIDGVMYPETSIMAKYIVRLAGIPMSSVDELSVVDFNNLNFMVIGFFTSSAETVKAKVALEIAAQQNELTP